MFKQLYYRNDKAYLAERKVPIHNFEKENKINLDYVKAWRDWLECDHVLRDQTHFIFVKTIEDIEFEKLSDD